MLYGQETHGSANLETVVTGDVYCQGNLSGSSHIFGDASASGDITIPSSNIIGSRNEQVTQPPVNLPAINVNLFNSNYHIGTNNYSVQDISAG